MLLTEKKINWLVVFTLFATAITFFRAPFEFYLFYVPILALMPLFFKRYPLNREFIAILIILGVSGFYGILVGSNTPGNFFKIYISICFVYSLYYYAFAFNKFEVDKLFILYYKFSYVVAIIGIFQLVSSLIGFEAGYNFTWVLNKWTLSFSDNIIRVNSIISEPSQLAFVLTPIIFISVYNIINKKVFLFSKKHAFLFLFIVLFTFSTHAYIVLLLSIIIIIARKISFGSAVIALASTFLIMNYIYDNYKIVRARVDDSILITQRLNFTEDREFLRTLNSSSFTLLNNYIVAIKAFQENPVAGGGLGSHPVSYEKYSLTNSFKLPFEDFNKADANSLFLRMLSETGLIGNAV